MAKKTETVAKSAKTGKIVSKEFAKANPDTTYEAKKPKSKAVAKTVSDAILHSVPLGTYRLRHLMMNLGFPAFEHDFVRLFANGIVKVNGEVVKADNIVDVTAEGVLIDLNDAQYRVVGAPPPPVVAT